MKWTTKEFQSEYNAWKKETSSLGKYHPPRTFRDPPKSAIDLEDLIMAYVEFLRESAGYPIVASKVDVQGTYRNGRWHPSKATKGVADILVCYMGQFIALEVKYGRDKQNKFQEKWEARVLDAGGQYHIITCFEDVQRAIPPKPF